MFRTYERCGHSGVQNLEVVTSCSAPALTKHGYEMTCTHWAICALELVFNGWHGWALSSSFKPHHRRIASMSIPDAKIHPVATGRAADTVAKHQEPQELVFYAGWVNLCWHTFSIPFQLTLVRCLQFCPFVNRCWIALEEKGIPYQYKEINPYIKDKHFLGASQFS